MLAGCQTGQFTRIGPQTHFDYPNSNVTPLGPTKVKVNGPMSFLASPDVRTSDCDVLVYTAALSQVPGANLITDYATVYKTYEFWPITWSKLEMEGTACKMEVGKKDINH
jgi:hypothetical protein